MEIKTNPVTGWQVGTIPSSQLLILEVDFISTPDQSIQAATKSPVYALTRLQTEELIAALQRCVDRLGSGDAPATGVASH